jgi:hypothetical protein
MNVGSLSKAAAVRELRRRIALPRDDFGRLISKKESTIEQYETEPNAEVCRELAALAHKHGFRDLWHAFRRFAGDEPTPAGVVDLNELESGERELAEFTVSIIREPETRSERSVVDLLRDLRENWVDRRRKPSDGQKPKKVIDTPK